MNRLSVKTVEDFLELLRSQGHTLNNVNAEALAELYNKNLIFQSSKLFYPHFNRYFANSNFSLLQMTLDYIMLSEN